MPDYVTYNGIKISESFASKLAGILGDNAITRKQLPASFAVPLFTQKQYRQYKKYVNSIIGNAQAIKEPHVYLPKEHALSTTPLAFDYARHNINWGTAFDVNSPLQKSIATQQIADWSKPFDIKKITLPIGKKPLMEAGDGVVTYLKGKNTVFNATGVLKGIKTNTGAYIKLSDLLSAQAKEKLSAAEQIFPVYDIYTKNARVKAILDNLATASDEAQGKLMAELGEMVKTGKVDVFQNDTYAWVKTLRNTILHAPLDQHSFLQLQFARTTQAARTKMWNNVINESASNKSTMQFVNGLKTRKPTKTMAFDIETLSTGSVLQIGTSENATTKSVIGANIWFSRDELKAKPALARPGYLNTLLKAYTASPTEDETTGLITHLLKAKEEGTQLLGYNIQFDIKQMVIQKLISSEQAETLTANTKDVYSLMAKYRTAVESVYGIHFNNLRLETVAQQLGIDTAKNIATKAHSADYDAWLTEQLYNKISPFETFGASLKEMQGGSEAVNALIKYEGKYSGLYDKFGKMKKSVESYATMAARPGVKSKMFVNGKGSLQMSGNTFIDLLYNEKQQTLTISGEPLLGGETLKGKVHIERAKAVSALAAQPAEQDALKTMEETYKEAMLKRSIPLVSDFDKWLQDRFSFYNTALQNIGPGSEGAEFFNFTMQQSSRFGVTEMNPQQKEEEANMEDLMDWLHSYKGSGQKEALRLRHMLVTEQNDSSSPKALLYNIRTYLRDQDVDAFKSGMPNNIPDEGDITKLLDEFMTALEQADEYKKHSVGKFTGTGTTQNPEGLKSKEPQTKSFDEAAKEMGETEEKYKASELEIVPHFTGLASLPQAAKAHIKTSFMSSFTKTEHIEATATREAYNDYLRNVHHFLIAEMMIKPYGIKSTDLEKYLSGLNQESPELREAVSYATRLSRNSGLSTTLGNYSEYANYIITGRIEKELKNMPVGSTLLSTLNQSKTFDIFAKMAEERGYQLSDADRIALGLYYTAQHAKGSVAAKGGYEDLLSGGGVKEDEEETPTGKIPIDNATPETVFEEGEADKAVSDADKELRDAFSKRLNKDMSVNADLADSASRLVGVLKGSEFKAQKKILGEPKAFEIAVGSFAESLKSNKQPLSMSHVLNTFNAFEEEQKRLIKEAPFSGGEMLVFNKLSMRSLPVKAPNKQVALLNEVMLKTKQAEELSNVTAEILKQHHTTPEAAAYFTEHMPKWQAQFNTLMQKAKQTGNVAMSEEQQKLMKETLKKVKSNIKSFKVSMAYTLANSKSGTAEISMTADNLLSVYSIDPNAVVKFDNKKYKIGEPITFAKPKGEPQTLVPIIAEDGTTRFVGNGEQVLKLSDITSGDAASIIAQLSKQSMVETAPDKLLIDGEIKKVYDELQAAHIKEYESKVKALSDIEKSVKKTSKDVAKGYSQIKTSISKLETLSKQPKVEPAQPADIFDKVNQQLNDMQSKLADYDQSLAKETADLNQQLKAVSEHINKGEATGSDIGKLKKNIGENAKKADQVFTAHKKAAQAAKERLRQQQEASKEDDLFAAVRKAAQASSDKEAAQEAAEKVKYFNKNAEKLIGKEWIKGAFTDIGDAIRHLLKSPKFKKGALAAALVGVGLYFLSYKTTTGMSKQSLQNAQKMQIAQNTRYGQQAMNNFSYVMTPYGVDVNYYAPEGTQVYYTDGYAQRLGATQINAYNP